MRAPPLLVLVLILLLGACDSSTIVSRWVQQVQGEVIPFETIALDEGGSAYDGREPHLALLTTTQSIDEIADYLFPADLEKLHQVDFSTHAVIALFRDIQPGTKHGVIIERIVWLDGVLMVVALFQEPAFGEESAAVEQFPFHLVKIPKIDGLSAETQLELQSYTGQR